MKIRNSMHVTIRDSGLPANRVRSEEYSLNDTMTSKKRSSGVLDTRNQIPIAVPGDKSYRDPTQSVGYYRHGGMIPGSTFINSRGKAISSTSTEQPLRCTASISASERRRLKQEESDRQQVFALNVLPLLYVIFLRACSVMLRSEDKRYLAGKKRQECGFAVQRKKMTSAIFLISCVTCCAVWRNHLINYMIIVYASNSKHQSSL